MKDQWLSELNATKIKMVFNNPFIIDSKSKNENFKYFANYCISKIIVIGL